MSMTLTKEVDFLTYCKKCKYLMLDEDEEPCCQCLATPSRENSHKPVYFDRDPYKEEE